MQRNDPDAICADMTRGRETYRWQQAGSIVPQSLDSVHQPLARYGPAGASESLNEDLCCHQRKPLR